jgi:hypothetical protein
MPLMKMVQVNRNCASWGLATWTTRSIALFAVLFVAALTHAQAGYSLRSLYDQHCYFELRDAIKDQNAPPLYLGTVPDSQPPMNDLPPGNRAILGFTFLSALKTIGWTSDGVFEIGFHSGLNENKQTNLWFDGLTPVTRVRFQNRDLDFVFDTGDGAGTQL